MSILKGFLRKIGLDNMTAERSPIRVFLLDDATPRHVVFTKRFDGDMLDIADDVPSARELLSQNFYDAIFLDHDLLPEHYHSRSNDDERPGYTIACWLVSEPKLQPACTIMVHT